MGTDPTLWPQSVLGGLLRFRASASQSACEVMVAWIDVSNLRRTGHRKRSRGNSTEHHQYVTHRPFPVQVCLQDPGANVSRLAEPRIGSVWWVLLFPESGEGAGSLGAVMVHLTPRSIQTSRPSVPPISPKSSFWAPRKQSGQTSLSPALFSTQNKQGEGRH